MIFNKKIFDETYGNKKTNTRKKNYYRSKCRRHVTLYGISGLVCHCYLANRGFTQLILGKYTYLLLHHVTIVTGATIGSFYFRKYWRILLTIFLLDGLYLLNLCM